MAGFCTNCGAALEAGSKFFEQCGTAVSTIIGKEVGLRTNSAQPPRPDAGSRSGLVGDTVSKRLQLGVPLVLIVVLVALGVWYFAFGTRPATRTLDRGTGGAGSSTISRHQLFSGRVYMVDKRGRRIAFYNSGSITVENYGVPNGPRVFVTHDEATLANVLPDDQITGDLSSPDANGTQFIQNIEVTQRGRAYLNP